MRRSGRGAAYTCRESIVCARGCYFACASLHIDGPYPFSHTHTHTHTHTHPTTLPVGSLCASDSPHRRTFLSWLHFAVVLGGLAVGLLNFGSDHKAGLISAALYTIIGESNHITGGGTLPHCIPRRDSHCMPHKPTAYDLHCMFAIANSTAANTASHGSHDIRPGNLSNARAVNQTADGRAVR